jgi:predicted amidohydrolase YtcJ
MKSQEPRNRSNASVISGNIVTMDPARPRAEAFVVQGDRVVYVGRRAEAVKIAGGSGVPEIRIDRGAVLPGLIDSHNHMLWTGIQRTQVDLSPCRSIAEVLAAVRQYAEAHPEKEWIVAGAGWHVEALAEKRYPTRYELDAVTGNRPVYLPRVGHAAAVNSEALHRAGIGRDTVDPIGGRIERDESGRPTGLLLEPPAFNLVSRLVPPLSRAERRRALVEIQRAYHAAGICGVIDPGLAPDDMTIYEDLWRERQLTVRSVVMPLAQTHGDADKVIADLRAWGVRTGFGDQRLKLGGVKVYLDGGASLGTALMREPYPDEKCQCGIQVTHTDTFHRIVDLCASTGWSIGVHAVGGKAIDIALAVFEDVDRRHPIRHLRFSLIHAYLWPTQENIECARRLNVGVATQASMQYQFAPLLVRRFGNDLVGKATPVRSWIDAGITVGGGSDSPVTPYQPLLGIWHAVTRYVDALGTSIGTDEAVSVDQALTMYTRNAAWLSFSEDERGMIKPGMLADWVALSDDPLSVDPMGLREISVTATAVGGAIVYGG